MKKILTLAFFIFSLTSVFAQTDGITYQAVIVGPDNLELPGVDSEGNYLPNTTIAIRFTIYDSGNQLEFQEIQVTETDEFGRINLLIGDGDHDYFKEMNWDGTPKDLKVEIDFNAGSDFEEMSRERLTFLPYAYHRNITATGTLSVDGNTTLNGELLVELPTNLNSTLDVNNGNPTNLSGDLTVGGETNLNSPLNINNGSPTSLSGDLTVDGNATLNGNLDVLIGQTTLNDLTVNGLAIFGDLSASNLTVAESTILNGRVNIAANEQVVITSTLENQNFQSGITNDKNINSYPLLVEGQNQGIAIKIAGTNTTNKNNFISFWDETTPSTNLREPAYDGGFLSDGIIDLLSSFGIPFLDVPTTSDFPVGNTTSYETVAFYPGAPMMWGRIEGETNEAEFVNNADYNMDKLAYTYDTVDGTLDLVWQSIDVVMEGIALAGSSSDVRPCVGFGACVTSPGPAMIFANIASLALAVIKELAAISNEAFAFRNIDVFEYHKRRFKGVSYASGAGDYAEYLLRSDKNETMTYGDIVGVVGGKISKNTDGGQRKMVISFKPAVLGALPQPHLEKYYEKVAFMGQVPVKVYGKVNIGDYIIPSGKNDGLGIAISPNKIDASTIKDIVGVAWESVEARFGFNYVNVAVGLNSNDTSHFIEKLENQITNQQDEINQLKEVLEKTLNRIVALEEHTLISNGLDSHLDEIASKGISADGRNYSIENDIIYFEITDADIESGIELAEKMMQDEGVDTSKHLIWKKLKADTVFKKKFVNSIKKKLDKQIHYHKEVVKAAGN
ncbi:hypothetical protein [Winogradskyella sp. PE311]|uniref:hypothetical protein n=1 Tax=Winogradskyella sp. PE311 TaxID=3366943 RepID=UPI00397E9C64